MLCIKLKPYDHWVICPYHLAIGNFCNYKVDLDSLNIPCFLAQLFCLFVFLTEVGLQVPKLALVYLKTAGAGGGEKIREHCMYKPLDI